MRPRALVLAGRVAALAVLVGALSHHVIGAEQAAGDCSLRDGVSRSVVRVIDGETLVVDGGLTTILA